MASSTTQPAIVRLVAHWRQVDGAELPGLPTNFPPSVESPLAWVGKQFVDEGEYILALSQEDIEELEIALGNFKVLGLDGDLISRDNFPLPALGPKLDQVRREVHEGKGFGVVRGLDPQRYGVEDLTMLYLGIQVYIANRFGRQDHKGNMLIHILADQSSRITAGHHRHSTAPISFHNEEAGDVVSWLTRSTAAIGGRCIIASCYTIYNILAKGRPELIRALARSDWPFALPHFQFRPVLFSHEGRLIMNFSRASLIGNSTYLPPAQSPPISTIQLEALDTVEKIAKATQLEIATEAGDIHFINNLAILHRREGFVDGDASGDADKRRHLVRMRLRDDEMGWAIPGNLQPEWSKAFGLTKTTRVWHLEPMPRGYFPLRYQPN